jgi:flagellar basal-body rod protein FlgG
MDTVANDLANVNTNGYKKARVAFRDLLYVGDASGNVRSGAGAAATTIGRSYTQGSIRETGNKLDVAIEDGGFLQVRRADGTTALTRDGALRLDSRGRLTTAQGDLVQPAVTVPAGTKESDVSIAPDGTVSANNRQVGRIQVMTVRSPQALQSAGDNLFRTTAASGNATALPAGRLTQGAVEASNVDVADSMTEMMDAQRSFQLASKAVQMQDQLLQIANQVKS